MNSIKQNNSHSIIKTAISDQAKGIVAPNSVSLGAKSWRPVMPARQEDYNSRIDVCVVILLAVMGEVHNLVYKIDKKIKNQNLYQKKVKQQVNSLTSACTKLKDYYNVSADSITENLCDDTFAPYTQRFMDIASANLPFYLQRSFRRVSNDWVNRQRKNISDILNEQKEAYVDIIADILLVKNMFYCIGVYIKAVLSGSTVLVREGNSFDTIVSACNKLCDVLVRKRFYFLEEVEKVRNEREELVSGECDLFRKKELNRILQPYSRYFRFADHTTELLLIMTSDKLNKEIVDSLNNIRLQHLKFSLSLLSMEDHFSVSILRNLYERLASKQNIIKMVKAIRANKDLKVMEGEDDADVLERVAMIPGMGDEPKDGILNVFATLVLDRVNMQNKEDYKEGFARTLRQNARSNNGRVKDVYIGFLYAVLQSKEKVVAFLRYAGLTTEATRQHRRRVVNLQEDMRIAMEYYTANSNKSWESIIVKWREKIILSENAKLG